MIDFNPDIFYYDNAAADRVVNWIQKYCSHVKGELAGKSIILEEWQKDDIIRPIFGIKRKGDKLRRFRTVYIEVPRKNGKSTLGAPIGLYLLLADGEPGAEIYSAAGDALQARIIFEIAQGMVRNNVALSQRCKAFQHSITKLDGSSFYKVISAEAGTKYGFNAHGILFDELFVQPDRELWDVLTTSTGSRRQPLTIAITTAGFDKDSICYEIHDYAVKVRDGIIEDDTFLPVLYNAPMDADIFDVQTWKAANPGFGSIVKEEYIREQVNKIRNQPSFESTFRRLHLNQWVGTAETWIPDEDWMKCSADGEFSGVCFGGLDLARYRDVAAFVLYFPGSGSVLPFFWVPEDVVEERSRKEGVNYNVWVNTGNMFTTPGNAIDHKYIENHIRELSNQYDIKAIEYDRWSAYDIVRNLLDDGFPMSEFGQGYRDMSAPTKELERLVINKELRHGGNPVLRWMCSNVSLAEDPAGNIKINRSKCKEKVDGMIALVMAIGGAMSYEPQPISRYESNPEIDTVDL